MANFHAEKSGHDQFEESTEEVCSDDSFHRRFAAKTMRVSQVKPLTEEERKEKLEELRAKVRQAIYITLLRISQLADGREAIEEGSRGG